MNCTVFEAGRGSLKSLMQELHALSLFSQKRVVILEKGEELKKEEASLLEDYFAHPQPVIYFIISASVINRATRLYKQAEKAGVILDIEPEKAWEKEASLVQKLIEKSLAQGKRIDQTAALALVKSAGGEASMLTQELEKLFCYTEGKNEISLQDVQTLCGSQGAQTIWQLGDAVFAGQGAKALEAAHQLLNEGEPLFSLLRQVRTQFQSRLIAATAPQEETLKRYPYLKGNMLQKQIQQARQFGVEKCRKAILLTDAAELEAKNSGLSSEHIFEKLILTILV